MTTEHDTSELIEGWRELFLGRRLTASAGNDAVSIADRIIRALERQLADAREERDSLRTENKRLQAEVVEAEEASRLFRTEVAKVAGLEYVEITDAGTLAALDRKREELVEAKRERDKWHTILTDSPMGHQKEIVRLLSEIESLRFRLAAAEERVKALEPLSTSKIVDEMPRQVELIVVADYCCPYFEIPEWDGDREVTMSIEQDNDRVVGWRRIDPDTQEDDHE